MSRPSSRSDTTSLAACRQTAQVLVGAPSHLLIDLRSAFSAILVGNITAAPLVAGALNGARPLHRIGTQTTMENREDDLPIAVRALLVIDVAVGQCISVTGTLVHLVPVAHAAGRQRSGEGVHRGRRRVSILLPAAAI